MTLINSITADERAILHPLDSAIADGGLLTTAFVRLAAFAEGEIVGREAADISWNGDDDASRAFTTEAFRLRAETIGDALNEAGVDAYQEGWLEGWQTAFRAATLEQSRRQLEQTTAGGARQ